MSRFKIWLFAGLAVTGAALTILYARGVVRYASSPLDTAVLVFAAASALIGLLGLMVSYLTYQLEAKRVPRPDVRIIAEGALVSRWNLRLTKHELTAEVDHVLREEREQLEQARRPTEPASGSLGQLAGLGTLLGSKPTEEDYQRYDQRVEEYLEGLRRYLDAKGIHDLFWSISRPLLLAFTNEKGGAPADGVLVRLRLPDEDGLTLFEQDVVPEEPKKPTRPAPPRGRSLLDSMGRYDYSLPSFLDAGLGHLRANVPPPNVSGPRIEKGSVIIEYRVEEILHNVPEDNRDGPVVLSFGGSGKWEIPYEIHARNLQQPKRGSLVIEAVITGNVSGEEG